jgi:hypothetical protein
MSYQQKYLKYKQKYLTLKNQKGGMNIDTFIDLIGKAGVAKNSGDTSIYDDIVTYSQTAEFNTLINASDSGNTPLGTAINTSNIEMITFLINKGADVNLSSREITPLSRAIDRISNLVKINKIEIIQLLIEKGANVNQVTNKKTPLIQCIERNDENNPDLLHVLTLLIDYGADVNKESVSKITPLRVAIDKNMPKVAQLLLNRGVNVNNILYEKETLLALVIDIIKGMYGRRDEQFLNQIEILIQMIKHGGYITDKQKMKINKFIEGLSNPELSDIINNLIPNEDGKLVYNLATSAVYTDRDGSRGASAEARA